MQYVMYRSVSYSAKGQHLESAVQHSDDLINTADLHANAKNWKYYSTMQRLFQIKQLLLCQQYNKDITTYKVPLVSLQNGMWALLNIFLMFCWFDSFLMSHWWLWPTQTDKLNIFQHILWSQIYLDILIWLRMFSDIFSIVKDSKNK